MNHHLTESAISHQRREPVIKMIGAYCTDSSPMMSRHDKIKHKKKRPSFQSLEIPTGTIIVGNFFWSTNRFTRFSVVLELTGDSDAKHFADGRRIFVGFSQLRRTTRLN